MWVYTGYIGYGNSTPITFWGENKLHFDMTNRSRRHAGIERAVVYQNFDANTLSMLTKTINRSRIQKNNFQRALNHNQSYSPLFGLHIPSLYFQSCFVLFSFILTFTWKKKFVDTNKIRQGKSIGKYVLRSLLRHV